MFESMMHVLLLVLCMACDAVSREEAAEKSGRNNGSAPITLRQCISDAVLCASEYLRTDAVSRSRQMQAEHEMPGTKGRRRCPGADRKRATAKPKNVCKEAECLCRYYRKEQRLMSLVRQIDAEAFKRFLYSKNKCVSGDKTKGTEGAVCETEAPNDSDEKFRLHMSSFVKRLLFLIAYLGYSFLRPELYSSDLGSDALALLPLACIIKTEVSSKESCGVRRCEVCNEPDASCSFARVCKSCTNKRLMEKYNRIKQAAQKPKKDIQSENCKNLRHFR